MNDRQLLEDAARAAGLKPGSGYGEYAWHPGLECLSIMDDKLREQPWNPLTDDGDALRLAVACGLAVITYPIYTQPKHSVIAKVYKDSAAVYRDEEKRIEQIEVYAATRRTIVRAAATIGRQMKDSP